MSAVVTAVPVSVAVMAAATSCGGGALPPQASDAEIPDWVAELVDSAIMETQVPGATTVIPLEKQECTDPDNATHWVYERRVPVAANEAEAVAQRVIALWERRGYAIHLEPRFAVAEVSDTVSVSVGWGMPGQPYVTVAAGSRCRVETE